MVKKKKIDNNDNNNNNNNNVNRFSRECLHHKQRNHITDRPKRKMAIRKREEKEVGERRERGRGTWYHNLYNY